METPENAAAAPAAAAAAAETDAPIDEQAEAEAASMVNREGIVHILWEQTVLAHNRAKIAQEAGAFDDAHEEGLQAVRCAKMWAVLSGEIQPGGLAMTIE